MSAMQTHTLAQQPVVLGSGTVVGPKEAQGPLGSFFDVKMDDDMMGQKSFEKAECSMLEKAVEFAISQAKLKQDDMSFMLCGDLLNQIITTGYAARALKIPLIGMYGACSTMVESIMVSSLILSGGYGQYAVCATASHFSSAERQYRLPLEMGSQRAPTSQWTVTAAGATVLGASGTGTRVTHATVGRVIDLGVKDSSNMGAAMAPAAADTILTHFRERGCDTNEYDLVVTGDLGSIGYALLDELLRQHGLYLNGKLMDCGCEIYAGMKDVCAGGSGCGCAASVLNGYLLREIGLGKIKKILMVATGALMSTTSSQQGESIPGIAHAVALEGRER